MPRSLRAAVTAEVVWLTTSHASRTLLRVVCTVSWIVVTSGVTSMVEAPITEMVWLLSLCGKEKRGWRERGRVRCAGRRRRRRRPAWAILWGGIGGPRSASSS